MVRTLVCVMFCVSSSFGLPGRSVSAQERLSSYRVCLGYVTSLEELNTRFNQHRSSGEKLIQERRETFLRLLEAKGTIEHFLDQQELGSIALMQAGIAEATLDAQFEQLSADVGAFDYRPKDVRYAPRSQFAQFSSQVPTRSEANVIAQQLVSVQMNIDHILHSLETVYKAGNLAMERHISLVQELQRVVNEIAVWQVKSSALFNQYWEVADVEGVKSDVELRLALRVLEHSAEGNYGAAFARAITLMRLGENEEALALLNVLAKHPAIFALASAARAELYARLGKKREFQAELRATLPAGQNDPRMRMHRAQALAASGDLRQAEREWEMVLKLGGHDVAAYRAIALINASLPTPSERNIKKATENAQLALQLAGDDWSCEAAVAMAAAVRGDLDGGLASAERASDLAIGRNQVLCSELGLQIKAGNSVGWDF